MAALRADIQNALAYIEENLTDDLDVRDIAKRAFLSPFYFQRIFSAVCGIGVGEYIRCRRLRWRGRNWRVRIPGSLTLRQSMATIRRIVLIEPFSDSMPFLLRVQRKQVPGWLVLRL